MQATVHRFDPETRSGAVITDQGLVIPFEAPALEGSGLRHLRVGQRLTLHLATAEPGEPASPGNTPDGDPAAGVRIEHLRLGV